ncbi:MAG: ATP-dependent 6-phosphofructokinase, partial [Clostridia bacterium]|nr:ATP-dependent 6-phosphofructokinase [Clostridia bacterium]
IGIRDGYRGLIEGDYGLMEKSQFSNILTRGGTILGTSRTPFSQMRGPNSQGFDKIDEMKRNYKQMKLDCLVTLGGNGTHKTAALLAEEGLNVIGLPKTIDNDIAGTDFTFGFHTAVEIATDVVDRIHTTADSHGRVMVIELMGNKSGWLTLYAGVAGGADVILLPEFPYHINKVAEVVNERVAQKKFFTIITVAEGAMDMEESEMKKKKREEARAQSPYNSISHRIAQQLQEICGVEARTVVPGHVQRGGTPCAYDRVLSTEFGTHAARMIKEDQYGVTMAVRGREIVANPLKDIAGVSKPVLWDGPMTTSARDINISFGV